MNLVYTVGKIDIEHINLLSTSVDIFLLMLLTLDLQWISVTIQEIPRTDYSIICSDYGESEQIFHNV